MKSSNEVPAAATLSCKCCGENKSADQFYKKGGQKPSWCKKCELAAKSRRRKAKRKANLEDQRRTSRRKDSKVLDIAAFAVVESFEHQESDSFTEIVHEYIEKIVCERTVLRRDV